MAIPVAMFTWTGRISPLQRAYYEEWGFLIFKRVFTEAHVKTIKDDAEALTEETLRGGISRDHRDDLTPPTLTRDGRTLLHRLPYFTRYRSRTNDLIESAGLRAIGAGLIGRHAWMLEDTMHGSIYQLKIGGSSYSSIKWHLDFPTDHVLAPVVSAGIYLDASTVGNGCLAVVPGSHRFPPAKLPPRPVFLEAEPGDVVCHSDRIFHGSGPAEQEDLERATLYLYFCGGQYPGKDLPFAAPDKKASIRQLFEAAISHRGGYES